MVLGMVLGMVLSMVLGMLDMLGIVGDPMVLHSSDRTRILGEKRFRLSVSKPTQRSRLESQSSHPVFYPYYGSWNVAWARDESLRSAGL